MQADDAPLVPLSTLVTSTTSGGCVPDASSQSQTTWRHRPGTEAKESAREQRGSELRRQRTRPVRPHSPLPAMTTWSSNLCASPQVRCPAAGPLTPPQGAPLLNLSTPAPPEARRPTARGEKGGHAGPMTTRARARRRPRGRPALWGLQAECSPSRDTPLRPPGDKGAGRAGGGKAGDVAHLQAQRLLNTGAPGVGLGLSRGGA